MNDTYDSKVVSSIVESELNELFDGFELGAQPCHDLFLVRVFGQELATVSGDTRSATSKLGNRHGTIARRLAGAKFGESGSPGFLCSKHIQKQVEPRVIAAHQDAVIVTDFKLDLLDQKASELRALAEKKSKDQDSRIGTRAFRQEYSRVIEELVRSDRVEPHELNVDIAVLDPAIGLAEIKAGGNLDNAKTPGDIQKLLKAALAYGDSEIPVRFACAYANRGEGEKIAGSLPRYLTWEGEDAALIVGENLWRRLLPDGMPFQEFLGIFERFGLKRDFRSP